MQVLSSVLRRTAGISELRVAVNPMTALRECFSHRPDILITELPEEPAEDRQPWEWLKEVESKTTVILLLEPHQVLPSELRGLPNIQPFSKRQPFDDFSTLLRGLLPWSSKEIKLPRHARIQDLLSNRQMEVFLLIGQGLTSRQISKKLGISIQTVGAHRKHIAEKLGTVGSELSQAASACYWNTKAQQETLLELGRQHSLI
jgi:DNA-binding CsgD family transcriptional regulator